MTFFLKSAKMDIYGQQKKVLLVHYNDKSDF